MNKDRRKHRRVPLAASLDLTFEEGENKVSLRGRTSDISYSGMGLYVPRQLKKGTAVTININFITSTGITRSEILKGRVVFTEFIEHIFFTGIKFYEELSPDPEREPVFTSASRTSSRVRSGHGVEIIPERSCLGLDAELKPDKYFRGKGAMPLKRGVYDPCGPFLFRGEEGFMTL